MSLVEVVERVEELLLGALLARDELDIVDQEEIDVAVFAAELGGAIVADRVDQFVGEALRGEIEQAQRGVEAADLVADGVQEVSLPQSYSAVDEQGVVGRGRQFGNCLARRLGELVRVADDERVEGIPGREPGGRRWSRGVARGAGR